MSNVMVVSAVMVSLSNNAKASLLETVQSTLSLQSQCASPCSANLTFLNSLEDNIAQINKESMTWCKTYREIDESPSPELYFDEANTAKLLDTAKFVRATEEMLRIQVTDLLTETTEQLTDEIIASVRKLRISVAKLRMVIDNVMSIESQLRPAQSTSKTETQISTEQLTALKTATSNAYYQYGKE